MRLAPWRTPAGRGGAPRQGKRAARTYCVPVTLAISGTETSDMFSLSSM